MRDPCHRGRAARQSSAASPDRCGSRWELLSNAIGGFDLSEYDVEGPLPDIPDHCGVVTGQTSLRNVVGWAREEGLTIRQLYERFAGARPRVLAQQSRHADDGLWGDSLILWAPTLFVCCSASRRPKRPVCSSL
jgi:hypothetical protein